MTTKGSDHTMKHIYRVKIHGRTLENCDMRRLLARAVQEKKSMDRILRFLVSENRTPPQDDLDTYKLSLDLPISRSWRLGDAWSLEIGRARCALFHGRAAVTAMELDGNSLPWRGNR